MALPTSPPGVQFPTNVYDLGPYLSSGGAVYFIAESSSTAGNLVAMKSTDPTTAGSWGEVDAAGAPSLGFAVESLWTLQDGDTLHVVTMHADTSGKDTVGPVQYHAFDMSTDSWTTAGSLVTSPTQPRRYGAVLEVQPDGDLLCFTQGPADSVKGTDYSTIVLYLSSDGGASWTQTDGYTGGGTESEDGVGAFLRGSDPLRHAVYADNVAGGGDSVLQRGVDDAGTFGDSATFTEASTGLPAPGATYTDGGGTLWMLAPLDGTGLIGRWQSSLTYDPLNPTWESVDATGAKDVAVIVQTNPDSGLPMEKPIAVLRTDGTDRHILFADAATSDLWRAQNVGSGWEAPQEVEDGITVNHLSANVYSRDGVELGYLVDKSGTVEYNEVVLQAPGGGETVLTADAGARTVTGSTAALLRGLTLAADAGTLTSTGSTATLLRDLLLTANAGSRAVGGAAASLLRQVLLGADAGSRTLSGSAADLFRRILMSADAGAPGVSGGTADLLRQVLLTADAGDGTVSGAAAQLLRELRLTADAGTPSVTGSQAASLLDRILTASSGSRSVNGAAADLIAAVEIALAADPGAHSVNGAAAETLAVRLVAADPGLLSADGATADLLRDRLFEAVAGAHAVDGASANLLRALLFSAAAGSASLSGADAEAVRSYLLDAASRALSVDGAPADVLLSLVLAGEAGAPDLAGEDAALGVILLPEGITFTRSSAASGVGRDAEAGPAERSARDAGRRRSSGGERRAASLSVRRVSVTAEAVRRASDAESVRRQYEDEGSRTTDAETVRRTTDG